MPQLIDLLNEKTIAVPLTATDKNGVINELIIMLHKAGKITDIAKTLNAILSRESQGSTGLENGIAAPHAKTDVVSQLTVAIGISKNGIDFDSLDNKPSKLIFMILAPPDKSGPHVVLLAEIAKLTRSAAWCTMLSEAKTPKEVIELFQT